MGCPFWKRDAALGEHRCTSEIGTIDADPCNWYQDDEGSDHFDTDCNEAFCLNDPTEEAERKDMKFCCYCGKPLVFNLFDYDEG
jgi:hypothetical protein